MKSLAPTLWELWSYRDELSVVTGIILKGECVYIPDTHRQGVLENLHTGHLGIAKTQLRARKDVFWPKINQDMEKMCKSCEVCQQYQSTQPAEPLIKSEVPSRQWSTIGTDLFQIDDDRHLITTDYYAKFPLVVDPQTFNIREGCQRTEEILRATGNFRYKTAEMPTCQRKF